MHGWSHLWSDISNAQWVATVGLPLAIAVIGLGIPVVVLAWQLESDRTARREDRCYEHGLRYAAVLKSIAAELKPIAPEIDATTSWLAADRVNVLRIDQALAPLGYAGLRVKRALGTGEVFDDVQRFGQTLRERFHLWSNLAEQKRSTLGRDAAIQGWRWLRMRHSELFSRTADAFEVCDGSARLPVSAVRAGTRVEIVKPGDRVVESPRYAIEPPRPA